MIPIKNEVKDVIVEEEKREPFFSISSSAHIVHHPCDFCGGYDKMSEWGMVENYIDVMITDDLGNAVKFCNRCLVKAVRRLLGGASNGQEGSSPSSDGHV